MTGRLGRAGILLALLYAVVAVATVTLSSRPVRPLFDGFAPPVPYNWVTPPPHSSAAGNTVPQPVEREIPVGPEGTEAITVSSDDQQVTVGLDKGAVPVRPPDTAVTARLVPLDPATLAPLPTDMQPISNAYQVALTYVPSQSGIPRPATKSNITLTAVVGGGKILHSADGGPWAELPSQPFGPNNGLLADFETTGYFVVTLSDVPAPDPEADGGPSGRDVLLVLAGIVPIAGAALVLGLPSPAPAPAAPGRRKRPGGARRKRRRRR